MILSRALCSAIVGSILGLLALPSQVTACEDHPGGVCDDTKRILAAAIADQPPAQASVSAHAIKVNRTLPVQAPIELVTLSSESTPEQISHLHLFEEPLLPIGGAPDADDTRQLAVALLAYQRDPAAGLSSLIAYKDAHQGSPWRASLELNLGIRWRRQGWFSRARDAWQSAWDLAKKDARPDTHALADRAIGELVELYAWVGRFDEVDHLLSEIGNRTLTGPGAERVSQARAGRALMEAHPETSFKCGPYAVARVVEQCLPAKARDAGLLAYPSTRQGTNLNELRELATKVGVPMQVARRSPGAALMTPCVVHWSLGHFGNLSEERDGRLLLRDATLDPFYGREQWLDRDAVDGEASGFFLVPAGALPAGWTAVSDAEAAGVWGRGAPTGFDADNQSDDDASCGGGCEGRGMPTYRFLSSIVSLRISDIPLSYQPPKGPGIPFRVVFNQREVQQPAVFTYANLGPRWTHNWFSYVQDDPTATTGSLPVMVYLPGGGVERFTLGLSTNAGATTAPVSMRYYKSTADLARTGNAAYQRTLPDGTALEYALSDGATTNPRKIFLTKMTDPQGNQVLLAYDASKRLTGITDALGQVTVVTYGDAANPLRITRVTDPFGRFAIFAYDAQGRMSGITDEIGLASNFGFTGSSDVITSMTTPYGTTTFTAGEAGLYNQRWATATDPLGNTERAEYRDAATGIPNSEAEAPTGTPLAVANDFLVYRNTFFWDKKAWKLFPGDYTKATLYHWLHTASSQNVSGTLESMKTPTTRRIWYTYPGQTNAIYLSDVTLARPSCISMVLPDGSTQINRMDYTSAGRIARVIDPLGRRTDFTYTGNGLDLLHVDQVEPLTATYRLATFTYGAVPRVPYSVSDASGNVTNLGYNAAGQVQTMTNPLNQVTTCVYTASGYLDKIVDPALAETRFTYDGYGRVRTVTNRDLDVTTFDYDLLDRPTQVTYADGTSEQIAYNRLDAEWTRDRLAHWTHIFTNALRQTVAVRDPQGRTSTFEWCLCGQLGRLIDPMARVTKFDYDLNGRLLAKTFPDRTAITNAYDVIGRLVSTTDAKQQVATMAYFNDNRLQSVSYSNAAIPTPSTSFTYDSLFGRLMSMTDGQGTTAYSYFPITASPVQGAGRLQSIDGPWANDVISYTYDQLGRSVSQSIDGVGSSVVYDALGRIDSITNALGFFDYVYDGTTSRLATLLYPNGQKTNFSYFGAAQDRRLQTIANLKTASGPNLSTFTYGYDNLGRITTWTRQNDSAAATAYISGYDRADQLVSAILRQGTTTLTGQAFAYDAGGNRTGFRKDQVTVTETANILNQLVSTSAGGPVEIQGSTNEPASVTVNGKPAQVNGDNTFRAQVPANPAGSTTVSVTATDVNGNAQTKDWRFDGVGLSPRTFSYDLNGNCTSDGIRTYTWDAADRLASIEWTPVTGTLRRTEFSYNGLGQRVRMVEKTNGAVTSDITYLWAGGRIVEERDATGGTVAKRYLIGGMMVGATKYFFTFDHLGSIREVTDISGNVVSRFDYDPYGNRMLVSGAFDPEVGYTGHFHHGSGLMLTWFRGLDSQTGRWLSREPLGESENVNLYRYGYGNSLGGFDPDGLGWLSAIGNFGYSLATSAAMTYVATVAISVAAVASSPVVIVGGVFVAVGIGAYGLYSGGRALGRIINGVDPITGEKITCEDRWDNVAGLAGGIVGGGMVGGLYGRGPEIVGPPSYPNGPPIRVAPFGNRTGNPWGELPHYHRGVPNGRGGSAPGQGIKNHRPWQGGF